MRPRAAVLWALAGLLALLPALHLALAAAGDGYQTAFRRWTYTAMPWLLGASVLAGSLARGRRAHQALGLGLMTVPLWDLLWGVLASFGPLVQGGLVLRPYSRYQLSGLYSAKLLADLGYLGAGFLLWSAATPRDVLPRSTREVARRLADAGLPMGRLAGPRGLSEGRSILLGLALLPPLLAASAWLNRLLYGVPELNQSDETSVFANMTAYHAALISLAAGFGEELVYRGLLLGWLSRRMPMAAAVAVQAVAFGFAHSGYGTWAHVLLPTLFGLAAGLLAWGFGLWAPIVLHVLVDIYAFGVSAAANEPWAWDALRLLFLANLAVMVAVLGAAAWRGLAARRAA